ncbi:MAG: hypothetical protein LDLANPLL_00655 [Turneriella sp.]|nr:hypothetical protein [Turneriella sp.]
MEAEFWNERYKRKDYVYGEEPNEFLRSQLKPGKGEWIFPADGEGRNAVYAASLGYKTFSFDQSSEGKIKALQLAQKKGVSIEYEVNSFEKINLGKNRFDGAVFCYTHLPLTIRKSAYTKILDSVKDGGRIIFEAFSKKQVEYQARGEKSGGPQDISMLFDEETVREAFPNVKFDFIETREVNLSEGEFHRGKGHVMRFVGTVAHEKHGR